MKSSKRSQDNEDKIRERHERREKQMRERQSRIDFTNSKTFMILLFILSCIIFCIINSLLPDSLGRKDDEISYSILLDYPDVSPEVYCRNKE